MAFVKKDKSEIVEKQMVFTTEIVNAASEKLNDGVILKRFENPWMNSEVGLRRENITFMMTVEEQEEYIKCAMDIHYFVEKYCKVKTEDGTINNIKLREYQNEILDNFVNNRFNILMCSRQMGKTISTSLFIIHTILFKNDKNVMIVANKGETTVEIVDKIKSIYSLLPFFLKPGIRIWNQKSLTFENGCRIKTSARSKTPAIGQSVDLLFLDEFAHIPSTIIEPYYTAAYPTVSAIQNSKIIITSTPNGMNLFHKLLTDAERPDGDPLKNNYKPLRVYWYQAKGRFVTYIKLNSHKMHDYGVEVDTIFELVKEKYESLTIVKKRFVTDTMSYIIDVFNNEKCTDDDVKCMTFVDKNGFNIPIANIAEVTTWKEETIKDIGGEDAFNQEYGLRFINGSKSLLNEAIIEDLIQNKKNYIHEVIPEFDKRLTFSYNDLKWIDDDIYIPTMRKEYKFVISVDIAEGLGQDYSIINIFRVTEKSRETIDLYKSTYTTLKDFYCLIQVGIYRNNYISVKQLSELLYVLVFEYLNPENCKVIVELNNYGNTLFAEMPHVFDGKNDYGSSVFVRYKHRTDTTEEKLGLKIGDNKNIMVKDYQTFIQNKSIVLNNEDTIRELTTFVKHTTAAGNTKYMADGSAHDDCVMTVVNLTTIFNKHHFEEMIAEWSEKYSNNEFLTFLNDTINTIDYTEKLDYTQLLEVRRKMLSKPKYGANRWK